LPLEGCFTYSLPESLAERVRVGHRVRVPFGRNKTYVAIVDRLHDNEPEGYKVKDVLEVLDTEPILLPAQLKQWHWISEYYMSPLGDVYKAALPAGLKTEDAYHPKTETYIRLTQPFCSEAALHVALNTLQRAQKQLKCFVDFLALSGLDQLEGNGTSNATFSQPEEVSRDELLNQGHTLAIISALVKRGLMETYEREVGRLNHGGDPHPELVKPLSAAQQEAYNQIQFQFLKKEVVLLHGVTSSGKTEIYIHLIQQAIDRHEQVLYLLPEIALTVQMMSRLQRVFGQRLGIYHSKYSDAERVEIWQKQLSACPYDVILGARSAVFLPFQRLGLVIVDEEHETSYKQQDPAPRYHARSVAIMLGAKTLLGTATPSAESYSNATSGKFGLVSLSERYKGIELPEIQVVDIADLQHRKMMHGPFSPLLLGKVREALERGEQAILFQNRRGYAPMIECKQCGWVPHCDHCDVSLTLHRQLGQLSCHYCGTAYRVPASCPACGGTDLFTRGYGTEKIEADVSDIFPEARIARMDLDTTRTRSAYERLISDFSAGRTNLLIGTQMISKGLDFEKVSVVGILNADTMLNYPDFRAYEHAFTMMAQVSGRAGRRGRRGLVILQTKSPKLPVIRQVVGNDYEAFFHALMAERRDFHYPPYYRLVYVFLKHHSDALVSAAALDMGMQLRKWFGARVLGPDKPAVAKVKALSIRKLVLKLEPSLNMSEVRRYLWAAHHQLLSDKRYSSIQLYFDVDPL